jgi:uncharacterized integral membrane protein
MPWRLLVLIVIVAILLGFIGLNLKNTCNISFGFASFEDVPVYLTVFASFILGMFCSLPFILIKAIKKGPRAEKKQKPPKNPEKPAGIPPGDLPYGID